MEKKWYVIKTLSRSEKKTISRLSLFKKYKAKTPNADYLSNSSISIPIHPYLKNKEIKFIIGKINQFFKKKLY